MRPGCGTELSTRADGADLPPVATPTSLAAVKPTELLQAEAERDTWRLVELWSLSGLPFDVELQWSAGSGAGASALVTVSRAARVSIFARSLRVSASNPTATTNRVAVTVADG